MDGRIAWLVAGGVVLTVSASRSAQAAGFDAQGNFAFDPGAAYTRSFEAAEPVSADAGDAEAGADGGPPPLTLVDVGDALHGTRVMRLGRFEGVDLDVPLRASAGAYRVSVWARGELVATVQSSYTTGRVDQFAALYPTGRMTSDGWYELRTEAFSVEAPRTVGLVLSVFSPTAAELDSIEFVAAGPARAARGCAGASDLGGCEADEVCEWGVCRALSGRVPALPPIEWRADLVRYLRGRFEFLFGPYANRQRDLPGALFEIDGMSSAPDAWSFWRHYRTAIARLHDWHTRSSDLDGFILDDPTPIAVCFVEGDADVSTGVSKDPSHPDVLVSHVGSLNTLGLHAGDRLVSVDGRQPVEWVRSLSSVDSEFWTASNPRTFAEDVARLSDLISKYADHVQVVRCDATSGTCATSAEAISVRDLPVSPPGTGSGIGCDNRPKAHVPGAPDNHSRGGTYSGLVVESDDAEAIYGLHWSSLDVSGGGGDVGDDLKAAVALWRSKARGVILDHRTGFGGTNLGPPILWNFVRTPMPLDAFQYRARSADVAPALLDGKAQFDALALLGQVESAGAVDARLDVPVALLITLDGSASDWLPLGLKGAPHAKIFGPYETSGAFSTLFNFAYWFGVGYSIAVGDTLLHSGEMLNGHGVEPDVVVMPKQSDLLAGRDTVYDAALAWVRTELAP